MKFEDFVGDHGSGLLRFAYVLSGDQHAAEDLLQTALVRVYRKWRRVAAADNPLAYVRKVLVNTHIDITRRRVSAPYHALERDVADMSVARTQDAIEHRDELRTLLAQLPTQSRTILVLRYYLDLSDADIARMLDLKESSVRSAASRALAQLRLSRDNDPQPLTAYEGTLP